MCHMNLSATMSLRLHIRSEWDLCWLLLESVWNIFAGIDIASVDGRVLLAHVAIGKYDAFEEKEVRLSADFVHFITKTL